MEITIYDSNFVKLYEIWMSMKIKGKKKRLSQFLNYPCVYPFIKRLSCKSNVNILAYHRVFDFNQQDYPFDEELISASTASFKQQMKFVSDNFRVVTLKKLGCLIKNGSYLPDNLLVITFDDGYADNYYNIFPVLQQFGLKGVFFISTNYIGSSDPFWFDWIIYLGKKKLISVDLVKEIIGAGNIDGYDVGEVLRDYLIRCPNTLRLQILQRLSKSISIKFTKKELALVSRMTWKQIREMASAGMEIGSHTLSHLILGNASREEVEEELELSKHIIEKETGKTVSSISYPVGGYNFSCNLEVIAFAKLFNYEWGVSYFSGTNKTILGNEFILKRLRIEKNIKIPLFKSILLFPEVFA